VKCLVKALVAIVETILWVELLYTLLQHRDIAICILCKCTQMFSIYNIYCTPFVFRIVKMLITEGKCDISPEDDDGMTPLHIVCQYGHIEVAKFLVDNGADVDHEDTHGCIPLNHAVGSGHKEIIKLLIVE